MGGLACQGCWARRWSMQLACCRTLHQKRYMYAPCSSLLAWLLVGDLQFIACWLDVYFVTICMLHAAVAVQDYVPVARYEMYLCVIWGGLTGSMQA
jgi:hypothetical protein